MRVDDLVLSFGHITFLTVQQGSSAIRLISLEADVLLSRDVFPINVLVQLIALSNNINRKILFVILKKNYSYYYYYLLPIITTNYRFFCGRF